MDILFNYRNDNMVISCCKNIYTKCGMAVGGGKMKELR